MDGCQVYHLPKGGGEIQNVIYKTESNQFVMSKSAKKIPKLRQGLLNFQCKNIRKQCEF